MIFTNICIFVFVVAWAAVVYGVARYIRWRMTITAYIGEDTQDKDATWNTLAGAKTEWGQSRFDLAYPGTRARLQRTIERHGITGSADIREGRVYVPVPLNRMHPLLGAIDRANTELQQRKNPQASPLYTRDPVNDQYMLVPDIDLDDLREIAEVLRAAVADKIRRPDID